MEGIQFDEEGAYARPPIASGPRGLIAFIMKVGLAKDEKMAQYLLLGAAGVLLLIAVALPFLAGSSGGGQKPAYLPPDAATGVPVR